MPITLQELAKLSGVSHTTVSLVLRGKDEGRVSEATRERIRRLARERGYRANPVARGLAQGRTFRLAICIYDHLDRYPLLGQFSFHDALARLSRRIHAAGYTIELVECDPRAGHAAMVEDLARKNVDGFMLIRWGVEPAEEVLSALARRDLIGAAIGTALSSPELTWSDVDRRGAIRRATLDLLAEGHDCVVLLDTDEGGRHRQVKVDGFKQALAEDARQDADRQVFRMQATGVAEVARITREARVRCPTATAFVLSDNFYADGVLLELSRAGITPGPDCRLIGFGDTALANRTTPRLTHYSLMVEEQVQFAFDAMMERLNAPPPHTGHHRLLESERVPGGT